MKMLFAGYGSIADMHVEALAGQDVELYSVVGRVRQSAEDFASRHGFAKVEDNYEEALTDGEVDAVLISSPSALHAEQTELALKAGKHVLCEIPLALSLAETQRLAELTHATQRTVMVCHTQRYLPPFVMVKQLIDSGKLHVQHIIYRYGFLRRENINWTGKRRSWTDNLLWHHGCHIVDTALWLLGNPKVEVSGTIARPSGNLSIPMDLGLSLTTADNRLVTIGMSYNTRFPLNDCLIIGEEESYLVTEGTTLRSTERVLYEPTGESEHHSLAMVKQNAEFLTCVRERREPELSPTGIINTMATLQAADA